MNVLIVGYGNIGKHTYKELASLSPKIYDPNISDYIKYPTSKVDVAFICVPTDALPDGTCDISIVEKSVKNIEASVLVIKSTVPVGTTEMLAKKYRKNLVFSPEYYGTTKHSSDSPNFLILGGNIIDCEKAAQVFYRVKNGSFKINYTTAKTAELAKYMENCFLALKVTFCNEFATVAADYGISYELLREIFIMDERMGESHTFVYDNQPFYDSHCLNKDIPAFLHISKGKATLINKMHEINQSKRSIHKKYLNIF